MKFSILATIAVSALTATSTPIQERALGGILTCTGPNATGECLYKVYDLYTCYDLPEPFYRNINTFAPDGELFGCYPRYAACNDVCTSPQGCTFGVVNFSYQNKYNLSAIGWDTLFKSFRCFNEKPAEVLLE